MTKTVSQVLKDTLKKYDQLQAAKATIIQAIQSHPEWLEQEPQLKDAIETLKQSLNS